MEDFLDILLEAKGNKPKTRTLRINQKQIQQASTDYTEEETDNDTDTVEDEDQGAETDETEDEDTATDYTEEEVDLDPEETADDEDGETDMTDDTNTDEGNEDDTTEDEATDYTDTSEEETGEEGDMDTGGDDSMGDSERQSTEEENDNEIEKQRILLADFTNLFYLTKNTIAKLSSVTNSNIFVNKIISQITSNLNLLKKHLFDYIVFSFSKEKYVTNLYKYNYFVEAFKINVQMLKKISVFISN